LDFNHQISSHLKDYPIFTEKDIIQKDSYRIEPIQLQIKGENEQNVDDDHQISNNLDEEGKTIYNRLYKR